MPELRPSLRRPAVEVIAQPGASTLWVSVQTDEYRDPRIDADDAITVNPRLLTDLPRGGNSG